MAYQVAQRALPLYSHPFSPKTFTQHQLFACLALKTFLQTDYRQIIAILSDSPSLCQTINLTKLPHYTTLQKADKKLYGRRCQAETVFSMIKRNLGEVIHARSYRSQCREMVFLTIVHNITILLLVIEIFYKASLTPLVPLLLDTENLHFLFLASERNASDRLKLEIILVAH